MQNESMQIIKSIIGVLAGIAVIWLLVFAFRENLKQLKAIGKLKYVIWVFAISALTLLLGFLAEGTLIVFGAIGLLALILYIFISDKRGPMTEEEHKALMKEINDPRYQARLEKENREAERDARRAEELINESRYGISRFKAAPDLIGDLPESITK